MMDRNRGTPVLLAGDTIIGRQARTACSALRHVTASRGRRVLLLLMAVWILNAFDLSLTIRAHTDGMLEEGNPVARAIMAFGAPAITAFKIAAVAGATYVLYACRRHRCAEVASAFVLLAYVGVAFQWKMCYQMYEISHVGGTGAADFARVDAVAQYFLVF